MKLIFVAALSMLFIGSVAQAQPRSAADDSNTCTSKFRGCVSFCSENRPIGHIRDSCMAVCNTNRTGCFERGEWVRSGVTQTGVEKR
jgi:hypothetical protein